MAHLRVSASAVRVLEVLLFCCVILGASASSAEAQTCVGGNLTGIESTTCNIGPLTFTFGTLQTFGGETSTEFTFNPVSNGFSLFLSEGPLSLSAPPPSLSFELAYLPYSVFDSSGNITALGVSGGVVTASSVVDTTIGQVPANKSFYENYLCAISFICSDAFVQVYSTDGGPQIDNSSPSAPFGPSSGGINGQAVAYWLATNSGAVTWDGNLTTFTFVDTNQLAPIPEPGTMILFGSGLIALLGMARKKLSA